MTAPHEIRVSRDYENDVLYVLKNGVEMKNVSNIIIDEYMTLRVMNNVREFVGFTIDEFSQVCPEWKEKKDYELMEEFNEILEVLNDSCKRRLTAAASGVASA